MLPLAQAARQEGLAPLMDARVKFCTTEEYQQTQLIMSHKRVQSSQPPACTGSCPRVPCCKVQVAACRCMLTYVYEQALRAKSGSSAGKISATELFEPPASLHTFSLSSLCALLSADCRACLGNWCCLCSQLLLLLPVLPAAAAAACARQQQLRAHCICTLLATG